MEQDSLETGNSNISDANVQVMQNSTQEKLLPQSKVDEIVRHATGRVAEKARKETEERIRAEYQNASSNQGQGGLIPIEEAKKLVADEAKKMLQGMMSDHITQTNHAEGQRIASEFKSKIESEKENFPELSANIGKSGLENFPHVVYMSNATENTAAVMNELLNNPMKMQTLENLAGKSPYLAQKAMQELSQSIKINQEAAKAKISNEPLSQLKPSSIGADNGSMSVRDFRKIFI